MSELIAIEKSVLTGIGDAIRERKDTSDLVPVTSIEDEIRDFPTVRINGEKVDRDYNIVSGKLNILKSILPHAFSGAAVVFNNEIWIFGGSIETDDNKYKIYRWNGSEWTRVAEMSFSVYWARPVVYHDKLYVFGGLGICGYFSSDGVYTEVTPSYSGQLSSQKWYDLGAAVVYNDEIHLLGSRKFESNTKHYKWNGSEWVSVSTLPYSDTSVALVKAVVYRDKIWIFCSNSKVYTWDGSEWVLAGSAQLPTGTLGNSILVIDDKIHIFGININGKCVGHMIGDGTVWTRVDDLPYESTFGAVVKYGRDVHVLGGWVSDEPPMSYIHIAYDVSDYTEV